MVCKDCSALALRVQELEKLVLELQKRLLAYENAHTPPSRTLKKHLKDDDDKPGKPGAPLGHEGTTRETPQPSQTIEVKQDKCITCNKQLGQPLFVESKTIEEIPKPQPIQVTQYLIAHYFCKQCKTEVIASHPNCPTNGRFGLNLQTKVALMKYEERLPHRKICEALQRDYKLDISAATVLDLTKRVSDSLQTEYEQIKREIRLSDVVHADETSMPVNGKNHWIWIFKSKTATLIVIRNSRGMNVIEEVLGTNFTGTIVCDGWKPYYTFTKNIQRCWAHLLREARQTAENHSEAKQLYKALKRLFHKLTTQLDANPPPEVREKLHANASKLLNKWLSKNHAVDEVKKFVNKVKAGTPYWFTFVLKPGVEPTNNTAEHGIRPLVVIRKIIGCLRNAKGTHILETLATVIETIKQTAQNLPTTLARHLTS